MRLRMIEEYCPVSGLSWFEVQQYKTFLFFGWWTRVPQTSSEDGVRTRQRWERIKTLKSLSPVIKVLHEVNT
jgi:hypothetical protein